MEEQPFPPKKLYFVSMKNIFFPQSVYVQTLNFERRIIK